MTIPPVFRKSSEAAIASYSFTDIAEGTGIVKYYGFVEEDSGGVDYYLSTQAVFSRDIDITATGGASASIDADFDLPPFNLPRTVKGTALVTFTFSLVTGVGTGGTATATAKIRKWDGSSETDLVTGTSQTITLGGEESQKDLSVMSLVVPETLFKTGEILRLTMGVTWTRTAGANNGTVYLGTDPQNRDGTNIAPSTDSPATTTKLEFYCPFKVDL